MANQYKQPSIAGATRFSKAPMAEVQFSRMISTPKVFTTFNAGDIVPIACWEVLPHTTFDVSMDYVTRLASAVIKPTMGTMQIDFYAYFVQNRVVNESWKNVQGENTSGFWTAPEVSLAPLIPTNRVDAAYDVSIERGSVADYYGFPTQLPIKAKHLAQCHDLKFRGYLSIYNEYFRDQNYQPEIPFSKLNVYQGFLEPVGTQINPYTIASNSYAARGASDGSYPDGAIIKSVFGEGLGADNVSTATVTPHLTNWSALDRPLKANKLHDPFTSVLPSPQKGESVYFGIGNTANVTLDTVADTAKFESGLPLKLSTNGGELQDGFAYNLSIGEMSGASGEVGYNVTDTTTEGSIKVNGSNLVAFADLSNATGVSINELRTAIATQQVYEALARSGSRYLSVLRSLFGIDAVSPFADIPEELGHIRKELDLFQVAQTSASEEGNTAQGNLSAFGYTSSGGHLFTKTFLEHGYVHIFAVVRHRNVYPTYFAPDNFRRNTLDFYNPYFANIGEQPIRLAILNPFDEDEENGAIGFQEAWWEYRYMPDTVTGEFRTGLSASLDIWTYADPFDSNFTHVNGEWLKSNSQEVLDRTLAVTSELSPQFLGFFAFKVDKQLPMPVYSVQGLDTI